MDKEDKFIIALITYGVIAVVEILGFLVTLLRTPSSSVDLSPLFDATFYLAIGVFVFSGIYAIMSPRDIGKLFLYAVPLALIIGFALYALGTMFSGNLPLDIWTFFLYWGIYSLWGLSPACFLMLLYLNDSNQIYN